MPNLMERQIFLDPGFISPVKNRAFREVALALGTLGGQKMPATSVTSHHFSGPGNFKAFRHRFFRFASRNRFWHKEPAIYIRETVWQLDSLENNSLEPPASVTLAQ
jgi:hypothetical protein